MSKKRTKKKPRNKTRKKRSTPKRQDVPLEALKTILARARTAPLSEEDFDKLEGAVDTLASLTQELEKKGASVRRLRKLYRTSCASTSRATPRSFRPCSAATSTVTSPGSATAAA